MADRTPRTLIRNFPVQSEGTSRKRPRRAAGAGEMALSGAAAAAGAAQQQGLTPKGMVKKILSQLPSTSSTPALGDARRNIRDLVRELPTDSNEKKSTSGRNAKDYSPAEYVSPVSTTTPSRLEDAAAHPAVTKQLVVTTEMLPPLAVRRRRKTKEKRQTEKPRVQVESHIPFAKMSTMFKDCLAALPKPNRASPEALEEAHLALNQYLRQSVRGFEKLHNSHYYTRERVEELLRAQDLVRGDLGDTVRRFFDSEDVHTVLALPKSVASKERMF